MPDNRPTPLSLPGYLTFGDETWCVTYQRLAEGVRIQLRRCSDDVLGDWLKAESAYIVAHDLLDKLKRERSLLI